MKQTCEWCRQHTNCANKLIYDMAGNPDSPGKRHRITYFCSGVCIARWSTRKHYSRDLEQLLGNP